MKLPTMYIAISSGHSGPQKFDHWFEAFNKFCDWIGEGYSVRIFKMEFDVNTNAFEAASEVTGDFADALQEAA